LRNHGATLTRVAGWRCNATRTRMGGGDGTTVPVAPPTGPSRTDGMKSPDDSPATGHKALSDSPQEESRSSLSFARELMRKVGTEDLSPLDRLRTSVWLSKCAMEDGPDILRACAANSDSVSHSPDDELQEVLESALECWKSAELVLAGRIPDQDKFVHETRLILRRAWRFTQDAFLNPELRVEEKVRGWYDFVRQLEDAIERVDCARPEPAAEDARADGNPLFDDGGQLHLNGRVSLARCVGALCDQLRLFLARLESCPRNSAGDYVLRDPRVGEMKGTRVLWDNVVMLAQTCIAMTLPAMTSDQQAAFKRDGVIWATTEPSRNAQPLTDALRQLLFSILYNGDGSWVSQIPSATVAKIRTIADELTQHRAAWERSEGGTTRTPTVTVSPDLLDRLETGIAVVHSIGSNFDAGMARVGRVIESLGARDDGPKQAKKPKTTRRERRAKWLAEAMLTVRDHPEWSDATIAERAGIDKSRLSRSPEYQAAARMARTPKTPNGSVMIADGDRSVEAVDDSFDPNRPASRQWQNEEDTDDRIDREMKERNAKRNGRR